MKSPYSWTAGPPAIYVFLIAVQLAGGSVQAQDLRESGQQEPLQHGSFEGVTRTHDGLPLAGARIVMHNLATDAERVGLSSDDGAFIIDNLDPHSYRIVAAKQGYVDSAAVIVEVASHQSVKSDIELAPLSGDAASAADASAAEQGPQSPSNTAPATPPAPTSTPAPGNPASESFFKRLSQAYLDDWRGTSNSTPPNGTAGAPSSAPTTPAFRGNPAPVDQPPYPFGVWPYGGSVTIGQPWTQASPLMTALWGGPHGEAWKRSRVQIYGWLNFGGNLSSSDGSGYSNYPAAYATRANSIQPDQEVLYFERQPDTVQKDHFDWGFRVALLYGLDYRFTTAKGIFSHQLLAKNQEYGFDAVMAYVDLYVPHVAQGLNIRIGRYISLPDIEAQLAPNNYTYSHSLLYTFDAYTQQGINATFNLSKHWLYQIGLSAGNDVAPWTKDAKATVNTCLGFTWREGGSNLYACANSINDGKYAYNNLQSYYLTFYHKFNSHWHQATEVWYQYEKQTPNVSNPAASSLLEVGANGAVCKNASDVTCYAPEWAVVNYAERQFSKHDYMTIRNEYFDDIVGQRTGFKTRYSEHLIGWAHWIGTTVLLRPELRFDHSYDARVYNNGTKFSQLMLAGDVIFFF